MSPRAAVLAVLAASLAAGVPTAEAKGVASAEVCGADSCYGLPQDHVLVDWGPQTDGPSAREPFYVLQIRIGAGGRIEETVRSRYLPGAALVSGLDERSWFHAPERLQRIVEEGASRLRPFPAAALPRDQLAPAPRRPAAARAPAEGGDGGVPMLAVAAPAAFAMGLAAVLARRRRRRAP